MAKFQAGRNIFLTIILIICLVLFIYWLWQRQPKNLTPQEEKLTSPATLQQHTDNQLKATSNIELDNYKVVSLKQIEAKGQTKKNAYIITASNATQSVVQANNNGDYSLSINFDNGLNLTNIYYLDQDLKKFESYGFTHYFAAGNTAGKFVFAGLVKNILDSLITVSTTTDDKSVKKELSTKLTIPTLPGVQEKPSDRDIRVGDYMVALGDVDNNNQLIAQSIEIFRDTKPKNLRNYKVTKITSPISRNTFSSQLEDETKATKITVDKDTVYLDHGKPADEKSIVKNKQAILIFREDQKTGIVADLIYLLP